MKALLQSQPLNRQPSAGYMAKSILFALACVLLQSCASTQTESGASQPAAHNQPAETAASAKHSVLVGTWEFVSGRYTPKGKPTVEVKSPQLRAQKIITPTHFSYVTEAENGSFYVAGAGRCKVESNKYTETLDYASVANMKNKTYTFTYRVEKGLWYMEGQEDDSYTEEVWRRVQ